MSYARQLLDSFPGHGTVDAGMLATTIDALVNCGQACIADADDDLSEQHVHDLVKCIRLCIDCADVCSAAANITSRQTAFDSAVVTPLLEACVAYCRTCGDECERHASIHAHCRVCLEACRRCERACSELVAALR
jgi:hypothetical protein